MKQLYRLKVYPKSFNGGDRIAVYIFSDGLTDEEMKKISEDNNFCKTAFVSDGKTVDFKVRFFIQGEEYDMCENSSVAVFSLLRDLNIVTTGLFIEETNHRNYVVDIDDESVFIEYTKPEVRQYLSLDDLKDCFNNIECHESLKPQIIGFRKRLLILPVKDLSTLNNLMPIDDCIKELSIKFNIDGIHAFALNGDVDAYGRNFMPLIGIHEESASTTASVALASYLYNNYDHKKQYVLRQGYALDQPSEILVKLNIQNEDIKSIWAGGIAYIHKDKTLKKFI